jgi:hypothetical protein
MTDAQPFIGQTVSLCCAITSLGSRRSFFNSIFVMLSSDDGPFLDQAISRKLMSLHTRSLTTSPAGGPGAAAALGFQNEASILPVESIVLNKSVRTCSRNL